MGYLTYHKLEIIGDANPEIDYEEEIGICSEYGNSPFYQHVKWYEYENDMRSFSKKYPDLIFVVTGEGEDNDDIWKAYFKDGLMFRAKAQIVFEEFSLDKLK